MTQHPPSSAVEIIPPALLLLVLILLGGVAAFFLSGDKPAPEAADVLLSDRGKGGESVEDLRKQIDLLLGQNEYLQGQVQVLQDENAQLIQKLGTLGMKGGAQPTAMPADDGIAPGTIQVPACPSRGTPAQAAMTEANAESRRTS